MDELLEPRTQYTDRNAENRRGEETNYTYGGYPRENRGIFLGKVIHMLDGENNYHLEGPFPKRCSELKDILP